MAASTMAPSICLRRDCWAADAAACSTRNSSAIGPRLGARLRPHVLQQPPEIARDVRAETPEVDVGRLQDERRLGILGQRQQQVLEGHQPVRLLARESVRPLQALAQIGRHGNRFELVRKDLRHQPLPRCRAQVRAVPRPRRKVRGIARQETLPAKQRQSVLAHAAS